MRLLAITFHDELPLIQVRLTSAVDWKTLSETIGDEVSTTLTTAPEPMFILIDLSGSNPSDDDIAATVNTRSLANSEWTRHSNLREIIIVSDNETVYMASKGLGTAQFGVYKVRVLRSVQEALTYISLIR